MRHALQFPLQSLRQFLIPDQVVQFKTFTASNVEELDKKINEWVNSTKSIIAVPGPLLITGEQSVALGLTFVCAAESDRVPHQEA